jgi:alkylhydroperoxidase family enzyme
MSGPVDELRASAASAQPPPAAMASYLVKVHERAYTVTDEEVEGLKAEGFSEGEIFEQTVAVAIGEGLRRLDAALRVIG